LPLGNNSIDVGARRRARNGPCARKFRNKTFLGIAFLDQIPDVTGRVVVGEETIRSSNTSDFLVRNVKGRGVADCGEHRQAAGAVVQDKLPDLLAALPRLIVNNMARGAYLIGSKRDKRVRAVQIVDCTGNSTTLRLKDYILQKIEPEHKTLPWQQDVAVLLSTNEKPKK
jgi:hypothetical protein